MNTEDANTLVSSVYSFPSINIFHPLRQFKSNIDLSIIVPVYNSELFVERCVLSLINQKTSFKYEIICINDGSSDGSLDILNKLYTDYPGILIVVSQTNKGIAATRNRGIEMSNGEFLCFVDNDDFVESNYVEKLLGKAYEEGADMVQCGYTRNDERGKITGLDEVENDITILGGHPSLIQYVYGYIWTGVYRRELFNEIRFPEGCWYEDILTRLILMNLCKKVCIIACTPYHKTIHRTNASIVLWTKNSFKSIDQYYLVKELTESFMRINNNKRNILQYNIVVEEYSYILRERLSGLPRKLQKAVFVLASDFVRTFPSSYKCYLDVDERFEKYLREKRYLSWNVLYWAMRFYKKVQWIQTKR